MATMRKERKDHLRSQQETARLVAAVQGRLLKEHPVKYDRASRTGGDGEAVAEM